MSRNFVREIDRLNRRLVDFSDQIEEQVKLSIDAVRTADARLANEVIDNDKNVDEREVELEEECLKLLALYQPVAEDLRLIVDFMYSGEVAVEQSRLPRLLEAARLLKIKGLWDNGEAAGGHKGREDEEEEVAQGPANLRHSLDSIIQRQKNRIAANSVPPPPQNPLLTTSLEPKNQGKKL